VSGPDDAGVDVRPARMAAPDSRSGRVAYAALHPSGLLVHGQYIVVSVPFEPFCGNSC
jgi:hypothetical protein